MTDSLEGAAEFIGALITSCIFFIGIAFCVCQII
jgi:hypothetical protein